jgi:hypothetical protein
MTKTPASKAPVAKAPRAKAERPTPKASREAPAEVRKAAVAPKQEIKERAPRKRAKEPAAAEAAPKRATEPAAPTDAKEESAVEPKPQARDERPVARAAPPARPGRRRRRPRFDEDDVEYDQGEDEGDDDAEEEGLEMFDEDGEAFGVAPTIPLARRRARKKKKKVVDRGARRRKGKVKKRRKTGRVRPSPPLQATDPLGAYLAGEMVPCPVGCGGFSEVVRVGSLDKGAGEVWFECLSCAQRKAFAIPAATKAENDAVSQTAETEGKEPTCPRHTRPVQLRRRGRQFVCPSCGVVFL